MTVITNANRIELQKVVAEKRAALRAARFAAGGSKATNVKLARSLRREVARALAKIK